MFVPVLYTMHPARIVDHRLEKALYLNRVHQFSSISLDQLHSLGDSLAANLMNRERGMPTHFIIRRNEYETVPQVYEVPAVTRAVVQVYEVGTILKRPGKNGNIRWDRKVDKFLESVDFTAYEPID